MSGVQETGSTIVKVRKFADSHEYIAAAIFFALLVVIFFGNVVFSGATLTTSSIVPGTLAGGPYGAQPKAFITVIDPYASAWQQEPEYVFSSMQFQNGTFPLWNPYSGFGTPFLAGFITAVLYPLNFLVFFAPAALTWSIVDLVILLKLFIAGFFTYCFMREIGVPKYGSLVSGAGFMFTGYFMFYVNMMHLNTEVLIPVLLLVLERQVKTGDLAYALLAAVVIAVAVFGGLPESVLYLLFLAGIYYLYRVFLDFYTGRNRGGLVRSLLLLVVAIGGGVLLSAVQILPFLEFWGVSWNAHAPATHVLQFRFDTISLLVPYFYGWIQNNWNGWNQHVILPYIGIFVAYFAVLAFTRKNRFLKLSLFFGAFAIFFLLKVYGFFLVNWIDALPLFSVSIFPKYCAAEFAFCAAVLAGTGISGIGKITWKRVSLQTISFAAVIALFASANLPGLQSSGWVAQAYGFAINAVTWVGIMLAFAAVVLGVITILLLAYCRGWITRSRLSALLFLVLMAELFIYAPHIQGQRTDPFNPPPYIDFLRNDTDLYRVVGMNDILYPNTATAYGISDVREKDPLQVSRYMVFLQSAMGLPPDVRYDGVFEDIRYRSLDMMNVKYVLSSSDIGSMARPNRIHDIIKEGSISREGNIGRIFWLTVMGKPALVVSAPTRIDYPISVPVNAETFSISVGMQPGTWNKKGSDGVNFTVGILSEDGDKTQFSRVLDPLHHPEDRQWYPVSIDLAPYRGETIHLLLVTDPRENPVGDEGAAWGNPGLDTGDTLEKKRELERQLTEVYNGEIVIYENRDVLPRVYFVTDADIMDSDEDVLRELANDTFNPRELVLLSRDDNLPPGIATLPGQAAGSGDSSVQVDRYDTEKIVIAVHQERPGILVVSDVYYPGWNAYVDGNPAPLFPADYAFRGVYLEPGDHTVTMTYEPESFRNGAIISLVTALILGAGYVISRRRHR